MGRRGRVESVRKFLEEARKRTLGRMYQEINVKKFIQAEIYNRFLDDILTPAIELCGEGKSKDEKNNPFIPPEESAIPGIMPNRGED